VTEKGYCHDPATGDLDQSVTLDIVLRPRQSRRHRAAAPGLLVAALARRKAAGLAPFAVMSCDNLPIQWPDHPP
jgi:fructuronate reductase